MSDVVYEDGFCEVRLSDQPCAAGHLLVIPKQAVLLEDLSHDKCAYLFTVSSYCATMLFEGLKAQGTNIIATNGGPGLNDEVTDRVCIHVIPRSENDGLGLLWQPTQGDQQQIATVSGQIKDAMIFGDVAKQEQPVVHPAVQDSEEQPVQDKEPEQDLRTEHFRRDA